jgi:hypothetical protein
MVRSVLPILALAALIAPASAAALEKSDVVKREFTLTGAGPHQVEIDNVFGSVAVRTGAAGRVTVEIRREAEARRADDLELAFTEVTLEVAERAGHLDLVQDGPFRCNDDRYGGRGDRSRGNRWGGCDWDPDYEVEWSWTVTVPADVDLEVSTVNGGEVSVADVRGRVEAANVNGGLTLTGLAGEVEGSTVNGPIRAEFAAAPGSPAEFQTVNGEIELTLPAASGAELGFETMNGEIYTDFEVTAVPQRASAERDGGRDGGHGRRYRIDRDAVVRIGKGGPRIDCQTLNGDIVVRAR